MEKLQRSVDKGGRRAQYRLGVVYEQGRHGVPKDLRMAADLYARAAEQGELKAMVNLGRLYEVGGGGVREDTEEAARLYARAAEQGDLKAQFNLGMLYKQVGVCAPLARQGRAVGVLLPLLGGWGG